MSRDRIESKIRDLEYDIRDLEREYDKLDDRLSDLKYTPLKDVDSWELNNVQNSMDKISSELYDKISEKNDLEREL